MHTRTRGCTHARTCVHAHAHTHARVNTRAHTQPSPPSPSAAQAIAIHRRPAVTASSAGIRGGAPFIAGSRAIEIHNTRMPPEFPDNLEAFRVYKKLLGRTETRTRDMMYLGRIRSVRDISRDDRARIANADRQTYGEL